MPWPDRHGRWPLLAAAGAAPAGAAVLARRGACVAASAALMLAMRARARR